MSGSHLKNPMAASLPAAIRKGARDAQQLTGKSLPCSVVEVVSSGVVRVKFEVETDFTLPELTVPILAFEYVRFPIQEGCKGMVVAADAYLGAMSGLGGGTATLTQPANLGALAFLPAGNKDWAEVEEGVLTLYGVQGVTLMDKVDGQSKVILTEETVRMERVGADTGYVEIGANNAVVGFGNNSVTVDADRVSVVGDLFINGSAYTSHTHGGVTSGGGTSGPVT